MAVKSYVGVSDVAEEVTKAYVGVNDVARKVNKIYAGVNGVAELVYESAPPVEIVTWSGGTDAQIVAMVEASDAGLINLSDYWSVGDTRTVNLSAMQDIGAGANHVAQTAKFVLMNEGGKELAVPLLSGRTTCSFVVGMKDCLNENGQINNTNTNVGGWTSSERRTWCNNIFKNSLPNTLLSAFKQFKNLTSAGNQSATINTDVDWFALPAEIEIFGTNAHSYAGEGSQFTYYETSANRVKNVNGSSYHWWNRSPYISTSNMFSNVNSSGVTGGGSAWSAIGISPFGVI